MKKSLCVFGAGMLLYSCPGLAEIYKWTDEDGNVHYTQSPPPEEVDKTVIDPGTQAEGATSTRAKNKLEAQRQQLEQLENQRQKEEFENEQIERRAELHRKNCRISRERLNDLKNTGRVRAVDAEGNVTRTTPEEHQARIDEAQKKVDKYCVSE